MFGWLSGTNLRSEHIYAEKLALVQRINRTFQIGRFGSLFQFLSRLSFVEVRFVA